MVMENSSIFLDTTNFYGDAQESGFDERQKKTLEIIAYIIGALLCANFLFLVANVIVYLVPLKVRSMLLFLFYLLSAILTISRSVELFLYCASDNPTLTKGDSNVQEIFDKIGATANVSIGCLFVATMYQISYSIRMLNDPFIDF